jgi:hypothetical protein
VLGTWTKGSGGEEKQGEAFLRGQRDEAFCPASVTFPEPLLCLKIVQGARISGVFIQLMDEWDTLKDETNKRNQHSLS